MEFLWIKFDQIFVLLTDEEGFEKIENRVQKRATSKTIIQVNFNTRSVPILKVHCYQIIFSYGIEVGKKTKNG